MVQVKVIEIRANRQYSSLGATFQPMNLFYSFALDSSLYTEDDNGNILVTSGGLETLFKMVMDVVNEKPKTTDF